MEHCCVCPSLQDSQIHRFSEARANRTSDEKSQSSNNKPLPAIKDANLLTEMSIVLPANPRLVPLTLSTSKHTLNGVAANQTVSLKSA